MGNYNYNNIYIYQVFKHFITLNKITKLLFKQYYFISIQGLILQFRNQHRDTVSGDDQPETLQKANVELDDGGVCWKT